MNRRAGLNIELKSSGTAEPVMKLIDKYIQNQKWTLSQFRISSFNHPELKKIREMNSDIKIGILMYGIPLDLDQIIHILKPDSIHIGIEFINREIVELIHSKNLKVFVYTVNHPEDVKWMLDLQVDGVFTDYPDRVKQVMGKQ